MESSIRWPAEDWAELDELIRAGWGDMRRSEIPLDWRTRRPNPEQASFAFTAQAEKEANAALAEPVLRNELERRLPRRRKSGRKWKQREQSPTGKRRFSVIGK